MPCRERLTARGRKESRAATCARRHEALRAAGATRPALIAIEPRAKPGARESSRGRRPRRVSHSCPSRGWGFPRRRRCLPASRGRLVRRRRSLCWLVWLTTGERSRCVYAVPTVARVVRCSRRARAPWVRDVHSMHRPSRAVSSSLCERCFITRAALQSVACVLPRHSATAGARVPPREPGVDRAAAPSRASRARRACPRLNHELGRHVLSRMAHAL